MRAAFGRGRDTGRARPRRRSCRGLAAGACWLGLLLPWSPAAAQDIFAEARLEMQRARVRAWRDQHRVPGVTVAIGVQERLHWTEGFGLADVENAVPATQETVYRLASISKPITATVAMLLAEQGKLDLDAPVQQYVPSFPVKPWPLTARHLLGHLGGVRHYKPGEADSTKRYATLTEALELFARDPLLHEPGSAFHYSTYGYNLLGCCIEGAAGQEFVACLRERVLVPAGMTATGPDDSRAIVPHRAQGYVLAGGELRNSALADTSCKIPGGGLCGTAADLVRFAIALRTGKLVRGETRERMWTSMRTEEGKETGYGCGWSLAGRDGERTVQHSGGQQRVSTFLLLLPDRGVEVAVLCNLERAPAGELAQALAREVAR